MRLGSRIALAAAVFGAGLIPAAAQEITGTIRGTVTDQTGAVLPGVTVTVRNIGTGETRQLVTSSTGDYNATLLPPGRYEVLFGLPGFQSTTARGINLHVNDRLQVDATLGTGTLEETVEVTAGAQLIQPTPAVQSLMGATQVQELPLNNRNFVQLATLVPGVTSDLSDEVGVGLTSLVSISVNGARRNSVNWMVDGASNVDVGSNITLLSTPTLESIEEFKIITSSYMAEFPRSGGGIINVVTKSGTNQFRGSAYEFFRSDSLNANNFFRNQSTNPEVADNPPKLDYDNFGYTLGGPIKKDKLFFFWSQEWRKIKRAPGNVTANVVDPAFLSDPANANYVDPADRDPNAVRLLEAWPAPNLGTNRFTNSVPNINDTRQEVVRIDYLISDKWRLMGRYTHDLSKTVEGGGLFFGVQVPNVATTNTLVPGQVFVAQLTTTLNSNTLNEFSYQFSGNDIETENPEGTRNKRSDYNFTGAELFPGNATGLIPIVRITGLATIGANQLWNIEYRNHTIADNLTLQRGSHSFKVGGLVALEQKNENAANITHGDFSFGAGGGRTAFQNFLRGNRDGACGATCSYTESEVDVTNHLRFNRYEAYVQDSWRMKPNLTLDLGVRYSVYAPVKDTENVLSNFTPSAFDPARSPQFANPAGSLLVVGTGDLLNGIVVAGQNSPHGRAIYPTDKNNFAPRLGLTWDPTHDGRTVVRAGAGLYYDQPLVGIFEQNAFVNPPFANNVTLLNAALSNPAAGVSRTTVPLRNLIASSDPFDIPRVTQWNVGIQRQIGSKAAVDVGYVGSRGDNLIRPVDINFPDPADVARLGGLNVARPFPGYGAITMRETTAKSRYHGLLFNFRYDAGRVGLLNLAYTLSRNRTDASNDRDAIDLPQNPRDLDAEFAVARTDRTHVFSANYVYELPFFRTGAGLTRAILGGWQIAGITQVDSGPPVSRIVTGNTLGGTRGLRVNQVGDPFSGVPSDRHHINPAAFAPPAVGTYGTTGRAIFRLPGRHQWDITLSKNWYPSSATRLQFRADLINAFNHTQFTTINNVCGAGANDATCAVANSTFGQYDGVRLPREIQLGLKFYWN
jgi:outer membrane receptor protein involved in Fe transport